MQDVYCPIAIIGGGVAALWTHNILKSLGYEVYSFSKDDLGTGQTLSSQGMIHGGQRYLLAGSNSDHSESLKEMPGVWSRCLSGKGPIDLSGVQVLSQKQYLFSPGGLKENVAAFLASKALNGEVKSLTPEKFPEIFRLAKDFKGKVYELDECVLDSASLVEELAKSVGETTFSAELREVKVTAKGDVDSITVSHRGQKYQLRSSYYIFLAGLGNEIAAAALLQNGPRPVTQRRPLKQIVIRGVPYPLFAHCITTDPRPRVTITSHPDANGTYFWYLGGIVAEHGSTVDDEEAINFARKEVAAILPWVDLSGCAFSVLSVDRAEPYAHKGFFKPGPQLASGANFTIGWPTKLTFAPALSERIAANMSPARSDGAKVPSLPLATPGRLPWETMTWTPNENSH